MRGRSPVVARADPSNAPQVIVSRAGQRAGLSMTNGVLRTRGAYIAPPQFGPRLFHFTSGGVARMADVRFLHRLRIRRGLRRFALAAIGIVMAACGATG